MNDKIDIIVAGVNRKDKKMWGDFYDRFYTALCVYVSKILPVPDAVEDLVQEVFISVWEGKRTFSDIKELTNYLYRACYNNALLYIRNNQIHDTILSSLAEEESMVDEDTIYALTVKEEIIYITKKNDILDCPATLLLYRRTSCRTTSDYFNEN
jgi:RNA polymerase sigma-70 factor (ECF subfamily)